MIPYKPPARAGGSSGGLIPSLALRAFMGLGIIRTVALYSTGSEGIGGREAWAAARLPTSRVQIASR